MGRSDIHLLVYSKVSAVIMSSVGSFLWEMLHGEITESNDTTHVRGAKRVSHYLFESVRTSLVISWTLILNDGC